MMDQLEILFKHQRKTPQNMFLLKNMENIGNVFATMPSTVKNVIHCRSSCGLAFIIGLLRSVVATC